MDYHNEQKLNDFRGNSQEEKDDYLITYSSSTDLNAIECMVLLIKAGANVNCTNSNGHTPLMKAASKGHVSKMALLIKAGANLEVANKQGQTAFSQAKRLLDPWAWSFLLFIMSHNQLENEVHCNQLRRARGYHDVGFKRAVRYMANNKANEIFKVLDILFLFGKNIKKNPFLVLPLELKRLIYLNYSAVSVKMKIEEYCPVFDGIKMQNVMEARPKSLVFSSKALTQKQKVEPEIEDKDLCQNFLLLSVEAPAPALDESKKNKKRGCIIV